MSDETLEPTKATLAWERERYPNASEEALRLLFHARPAIRRFLDSSIGLPRPRDAAHPTTKTEGEDH